MATKKKEKKSTKTALTVLRDTPPVDVSRDMNHLADNAKSGQANRTKSQLKYDIEVRKIESENQKIQSDERIEFEKFRTQRIKYYVWAVVILVVAVAGGIAGKSFLVKLGATIIKKFGG